MLTIMRRLRRGGRGWSPGALCVCVYGAFERRAEPGGGGGGSLGRVFCGYRLYVVRLFCGGSLGSIE